MDHIEHFLEHDRSFSAVSLQRDEFRLVVCIPLEDAAFEEQRESGWHEFRHNEAIRALADFVVFTRTSALESTTRDIEVTATNDSRVDGFQTTKAGQVAPV